MQSVRRECANYPALKMIPVALPTSIALPALRTGEFDIVLSNDWGGLPMLPSPDTCSSGSDDRHLHGGLAVVASTGRLRGSPAPEGSRRRTLVSLVGEEGREAVLLAMRSGRIPAARRLRVPVLSLHSKRRGDGTRHRHRSASRRTSADWTSSCVRLPNRCSRATFSRWCARGQANCRPSASSLTPCARAPHKSRSSLRPSSRASPAGTVSVGSQLRTALSASHADQNQSVFRPLRPRAPDASIRGPRLPVPGRALRPTAASVTPVVNAWQPAS